MNTIRTLGLILLGCIFGSAPVLAHDCWRHNCDRRHCNFSGCPRYRSDTAGSSQQSAAPLQSIQGKIAEINYLPSPNPDDALVEARVAFGTESVVVRLAPASFFKRNGIPLKEGDTLSLRGYRVGAADGEVLVATEIDREDTG